MWSIFNVTPVIEYVLVDNNYFSLQTKQLINNLVRYFFISLIGVHVKL